MGPPHPVPAALVESLRPGHLYASQWTLLEKQILMKYLPTGIHSGFIHDDLTWKYPRCPSIGERIKIVVSIQGKSALLIHVMTDRADNQ